jgi:geranylgeranyl pyrophosphate synthase
LKTGALVALAVELGCLAAHPQSPLCFALPKFGRQIGIALQMRNDLDELAQIAHCRRDDSSIDKIRDDDLRNARLTWPWAWAFQLHGEDHCISLVQRCAISHQERHEVAAELYELAGSLGNEVIRANVRDQLRLLAEHVIDRRLLELLSEILEPIERPIIHAATTGAGNQAPTQPQTVI